MRHIDIPHICISDPCQLHALKRSNAIPVAGISSASVKYFSSLQDKTTTPHSLHTRVSFFPFYKDRDSRAECFK